MEAERIESLIKNLNSSSEELQTESINTIITSLETETSILNLHMYQKYLDEFIKIFSRLRGENKQKIADIISFFSITGNRILEFRQKGGIIPINTFGFQYAKEILRNMKDVEIFDEKIFNESLTVIFDNNSEIDGIDFLLEFKKEDSIINFVNKQNFKRMMLYLTELNKYLNLKNQIFEIYKKMGKKLELVLIYINEANSMGLSTNTEISNLILEIFQECTDSEKLQICFILNRTRYYCENLPENYKKIALGFKNSELINYAIKDFEIKEKEGDELADLDNDFKFLAHTLNFYGLQESSATKNMTSTDFGGMRRTIYSGLLKIDKPDLIEKYSDLLFSDNEYQKAGSLGTIAFSSTFYDENHTILALLVECINNCDLNSQKGEEIVIPLLLAIENLYSCSQNMTVKKILIDFLNSEKISRANKEIFAHFTCFVLGSVFCSSYNDEIISLLIFHLSESNSKVSENSYYKMVTLGLGLVLMNNNEDEEKNDLSKNFLKSLEENPEIEKETIIFCRAMSSRNKTDFKDFIKLFEKSFTETNNEDDEESFSIEMNDNVLNAESCSIFGAMLVGKPDEFIAKLSERICTSTIFLDREEYTRSVCMSLAFLYPSNPKQSVIDSLVMLANSGPKNIVLCALISLSIVGAGTKNTQILDFLEDQAIIFGEGDILGIISICEGIVNLGKGTAGIFKNLYNKKVENVKSTVGLISFLYSVLFLKPDILEKNLDLFLILTKSFSSKIVNLVDKDLNILNKDINIGTPVDIIGVAGNPSDICAVQVLKSPVVIQNNEKGKIDGLELEVEGTIVV